MLMTTLAVVPGYAYEVIGFVIADRQLQAMGKELTQRMVQSLTEQAGRLGANAVVDVKTVIGGDNAHCVITGTAVRLLPQAQR